MPSAGRLRRQPGRDGVVHDRGSRRAWRHPPAPPPSAPGACAMRSGKGRPSALSAALPGRLTRPPGRGMVVGMDTVFDTLAYTRRLAQAGVEDKHAEALTDALRAGFSAGVASSASMPASRRAWTRWRRTCAPCSGSLALSPPCSS